MIEGFRLDGKVALVTGGTRGLGRAMARGLAQAGADVVITGREVPDPAAALAPILEGTKVQGLALAADMADRPRLAAAVDEAVGRFGKIDILVNNAGINVHGSVDEVSDADWDRVLGVNLAGVQALSRAVVPVMRRQGAGRIVNISSIFGLTTMERRTAYSASKAGLIAMTRTMAIDLAKHGITVNAIAPGPFSTELTDKLVQGTVRDYFQRRIPMRRWGEPRELLGPLLLLVSDMGSYMTGSVVVVDGGWTAGESPSAMLG